jgi:hypothetical protein
MCGFALPGGVHQGQTVVSSGYGYCPSVFSEVLPRLIQDLYLMRIFQ